MENLDGPTKLVGASRFELLTPGPPCQCATRLRHAPISQFRNDLSERPAPASPPVPLRDALSAGGGRHAPSYFLQRLLRPIAASPPSPPQATWQRW